MMVSLFIAVLAIFLNVLSAYLHYATMYETSYIPAIIWIVSIGLWLISLRLYKIKKHTDSNHDTKRNNTIELIMILGIFLFAITIRVLHIMEQPAYLDEWYWIHEAQNILTGVVRSPFGYIGDQPSNLAAFPTAFFLYILKQPLLSLRITAVVFNLSGLLFLYLFTRSIWDKKIALLTLLFASVSIWSIHMSFQGWQNLAPVPLLVVAPLFFLQRALKRSSFTDAGVCGIIAGCAINTVYISALVVVVIASWNIYHFFKKRTTRTSIIIAIVWMSIILTASPTISKSIAHPTLTLGRHVEFMSENNLSSGTNLESKTGYYLSQMELVVNDFSYRPSSFSTVSLWGIVLEPLFGLLFVVGFFGSLLYINRFRTFLLYVGLLIFSIPLVILSRGTSIWREYAMSPFIFIFCALGYEYTVQYIKKFFETTSVHISQRKLKTFGFVCLMTCLGLSFFTAYNSYRKQYLDAMKNTYEYSCKKNAETLDKYNVKQVALAAGICTKLIEISSIKHHQFFTFHSEQELIRYASRPEISILSFSSDLGNFQEPVPNQEVIQKNFVENHKGKTVWKVASDNRHSILLLDP